MEGSGLTRSVPHAQGFWVECSLRPFSLAPPPRSSSSPSLTSCLPTFPVPPPQYPGTYLTFEVVSLVPYDRNLIDISLLSPEQVSERPSGLFTLQPSSH